MCGIAGIASWDRLGAPDGRLVETMLHSLAHRGPDDHQVYLGDSAVLGARRLAIIDLDTGRQPIPNEDSTIWTTQNGEIYDYVELRESLLRDGHVLRTKGDTEVLVHAYEQYGEAFVRHLRGMFAIAIWDAPRRRLVLARDRLGKKPLYWRLADGRLSWGSELKALMADPSMPRELDHAALAMYLQYGYVPSPLTIFQGVHKLPPASVLVWEGGEPRISTYWDIRRDVGEAPAPEETTAEAVRLLREAVRLRLRSDVPVGAFLSGGMDSSVVTALMAEASGQPVRTFSIGFTEESHNELPYARAVAQHLGTDHVEDIVSIDATALLPTLAWHFDEPFGDSSALPTFRVAEMAGGEMKVVLTGDGGDESFGGYTRYLKYARIARLARLPGIGHMSVATDAALSRAPSTMMLRQRARIWRQLLTRDADELYISMVSPGDPEVAARLLRDASASDQTGYLRSVLRSTTGDPLERLMQADLVSYLPEDVLVKVDRATMANSLEARSPLLDHKVVEFAAALPLSRRISGGRTKVLLREVALTLLPETLVDRPKMGFGVPLDDWFKGRLAEPYSVLVLAPDASSRSFIDQAVARALLEQRWTGYNGAWALSGGTLIGASACNRYLANYGIAYCPAGTGWSGDYSIEARIKFQAGAYGGGVGGRLYVNDANPNDPNNGRRYAAWVFPEGSTASGDLGPKMLALIKFTEWTTWPGTPIRSVALASVGTNWHVVKLALSGNEIQVWYDGVQKIAVPDGSYSSGGVTLDMWTDKERPYTMSVDDVVVSP